MAYSRYCRSCGQPIIMSTVDGRWQPWELDGSGRHKCFSDSSAHKLGLSSPPSTSLSPDATLVKTFRAKCFWCAENIFHHTNGHRDYVLFDHLGYPWQVHSCWQKYWKSEKERRRVLDKLKDTHERQQVRQSILLGCILDIQKNPDVLESKSIPTKAELAESMDLEIEEFNEQYGDLYKELKKGRPSRNSLRKQHKEITQKIPCPHCRKRLKGSLIKHVQTVHKFDPLESIELQRGVSNLIICTFCGKLFHEKRIEYHLKYECEKAQKYRDKKSNQKEK